MATSFTPYTYIQCPCSDAASPPHASKHESSGRPSSSGHDNHAAGEQDEDDRTFDPRAPRSNYSLYPLEYLLYCEDCHQIRCPRCVAEEIVTHYCPNCLFEVPTSNLKSEGNRCTRSCFQCPVCVAPLTVTNLETPTSSSHLAVPDSVSSHSGGYVLSCSYCQWSSTEIGIKFDKANGLYSQLAKVRNGGKPRPSPPGRDDKRRDLSLAASIPTIGTSLRGGGPVTVSSAAETDQSSDNPVERLDLETQFSNLKLFYERQLAETSGAGMGGLASFGDLGFGSPASLSRIMSMYTSGMAGSSARLDKKAQSRIRSMREARDVTEGFQAAELDESAAIARLQQGSAAASAAAAWDATASLEQQAAQAPFVGDEHLYGRSRFLDELRPIPFLLRTKRSKRCPICRHIISKPETKSTSNRFRIRLVAGSYIPSISIRPLNNAAAPAGSKTGSSAAAEPSSQLLEPLKPVQYILTFKNPIFESVKVTLATPSTTPGRFASKVTVLCPQFEIDSNTDVWDDALRDSGGAGGGSGSGSGSGRSRRDEDQAQQQQQQAVAGKIWERGRNWVSIVVEVVPPSLNLNVLAMTSKPLLGGGSAPNDGKKVDLGPLQEDEDVVEIPMSVRVEWETDPAQEVGMSSARDRDGRDRDGKERRELSYWCVLGLGRIRQD